MAFKVREPNAVVFNQRQLLDVMYLPSIQQTKQRAVLHVIDQGKHFNAATFLPALSTSAVWNAFLRVWASMYIGMPESMLSDYGSVFISDEWRYACDLYNIELHHTGIESHNSLNIGETYHAYLRRIYLKVRRDHARVDDETVLAISIKALNDTIAPKGLCPTLLVFGVAPKPRIRLSKLSYPEQTMHFKAAQSARDEYERIATEERVKLAANK